MNAISYRGVVIAGVVWLLGSGSECLAGDLRHLLGHHSGCNCGSSIPAVVHATPVYHSDPIAESGCACTAAVSSCCGIGGGLTQIGSLYGFGFHGYTDTGLTGFEGLPNMDGGGINHRYPYHSYRRPWAHPGPPSTNVSIVW